MQFSQEELKNLAVLLERITLNGKEVLPVAQLQLKIQNLIKAETTSKLTGTEPTPTSETTSNENSTAKQV